jgi:hypothetical protein
MAATVIDIASRRVIGFAIADHLRTELISDALANAVAARDPDPGVVFHSDRMHAGGRMCNLERGVDAGQGFLWGHEWLLKAGWQRYSTEVQQRTRTEVAA